MHPLRVLLLVSLFVAAAVAWGLGAALQQAGVEDAAAVGLAIASFLAFMVPWTGVAAWAVRRAADLDALTERSRRAAEKADDVRIADRRYHGELDDLARAIEELRSTIVRQRLSHEEHRAAMEEIVSSLGEGLLAVSPRGTVVVANPRAAEMFGIDGPLIGRPVLEIVRKQTLLTAIDRALRGESSVDRVTVGTGDMERQIEIRTVPVEASPEIAAVALFIDITTLERLQRVRREFLDDFSHEVRTPLAGLKSAAETLDSGGLTAEHDVQLRQVMQRQITRIERLVTDLAELNQIETGQLVLERKPVALRALLEELCAEVEERNPEIRFLVRGAEVEVAGDALRIQQVFSNLLDNAVRHGRPREENGGGGPIDIEVEVSAREGEAAVTVSDYGPGIPASDLERIFHRFYRADRSRSQPGTGLGLAIARHLVVLHGGSIRAFNRPDGEQRPAGATFEVRLPSRLT